MRTTRFAVLMSLILLVTAGASAASLGALAGWDETPEAYYMTESERQAWKKIASEEEAARFVEEYFSRRGDGFREELDRRIEVADQYLSRGKTKGSERLQGKLVILLGAPAAIVKKNKSEMGRAVGTSTEASSATSNVSGDQSTYMRIEPDVITYTFDDPTVLGVIGKEGRFVVDVTVDTANGKESIRERKMRKALDDAFEKIAQFSIVVP
jgi:GWxTD domain-containing protein